MSGKEALIRGLHKRYMGGMAEGSEDSFVDVCYSVNQDERAPAREGGARMACDFAVLVRPIEGSEGTQSEVWRSFKVRLNSRPKTGAGASRMLSGDKMDKFAVVRSTQPIPEPRQP